MRIRPHHTPVHPQSPNLSLNPLLSNLNKTIRHKPLHRTIHLPLRTRRNLHIPELPNPLHITAPLEQPHSLTTSHTRLQMIIIRISRMMRNHHIRLTLPNRPLNKLNQLQMRHSIHLNIRERRLKLPVNTNKIRRSIRIPLQLRIRRPESPRLSLSTHNRHINHIPIMRPFPHRRTRPKDLIVGMRHNQ